MISWKMKHSNKIHDVIGKIHNDDSLVIFIQQPYQCFMKQA